MFHNHDIGPATYETYPVARGIKDAATAARADEMVTDGVRRLAIYDMLLQKGENDFKVDVDNFVNSHATRLSLQDDNEATAMEVARFAVENEGGVSTVDQTPLGETGVISLTTQHVRTMFERFGELVLVDCTHKTNRDNYLLLTIMVMGKNGNGQVVQQSLLETNADWHMERALRHIERANPDTFKLVRVIMVDKDLNEIKVLASKFKQARILICLFHVLKYLSHKAKDARFGKLSSDDYELLDNYISNMVYAPNETEFEDEKLVFILACERLEFMGFVEYMDKNWFDCTDMWALHTRANLPHFKNHTNNRLENWVGKFKQGVKETSSLSECVKELLRNGRLCQREYELEFKRTGQDYNAHYDEEMAHVLLMSTPFVAKQVEPEYTAAVNKHQDYVYDVSAEDALVVVKGKRNDHVVDLTDWSCDCTFAISMRLPCRHAMAYRKNTGGAVIPLKRIDVRWKRVTRTPSQVKRFVSNEGGDTGIDVEEPPPPPPTNARDRYKEAMRVLQPVCSELAEIEDYAEFKEFLAWIMAQWRNVRQRKRGGQLLLVQEPAQNEADPSQHRDEPSDLPESQVQLSQANSLWSAKVGDVPEPVLHDLHIPEPSALVPGSGALAQAGQPGTTWTRPGQHW